MDFWDTCPHDGKTFVIVSKMGLLSNPIFRWSPHFVLALFLTTEHAGEAQRFSIIYLENKLTLTIFVLGGVTRNMLTSQRSRR